jgi:hypothetical protein
MSDDDDLLRALGRTAAAQRDEEHNDPMSEVWERAVRGQLTAQELHALEALAEHDEAVGAKLEAFQPLHATARAAIVEDLHAHRRPILWSSRVRTIRIAAAVALAASVALVLRPSPPIAPVPLTVYTLEATAPAATRGPGAPSSLPEACTLHSYSSGTFELWARTENDATGTVNASAFVVRDGEAEAWRGNLEVASSGSIRIVDARERLTNVSALRLVIARPGVVTPARARALARSGPASGAGWQVLSCAVSHVD